MAFQCGHLEAQDVLGDPSEVDLVSLEATAGFERKLHWIRRLLYRDVTGRLAYANPGLRRVRLERDYDLLVVMCQGYWEFLYLNAIDGWKDRCKTSVIWIDEFYAADVADFKYWLPSLRRFDHVVVGQRDTVGPLSEALGKPCHYVPGGVDALRFSPYPDPPDRVVDIYSIGRKVETLHRAALALAADHCKFYLHDTLHTGGSQALDHRQHRDLYASVAKRSRLFMVAPGKVDQPQDTGGQVAVGFRYYEGAAAGAVMLGQAPPSQEFRELFDWPEAVVEVKLDGSDLARTVQDLLAEPKRMHDIGQRNACEALLRHDWIYRWSRIFEIAGVEPTPSMRTRKALLSTLAERARKS